MSVNLNSGANNSSSLELNPQELEAAATVVLNRAALGIVKDSLEVSFTQLGGNPWHYSSSASRPSLPPLINGLVDTSLQKIAERAWDTFFEDLKKNLPIDTADRLTREKAKSKEERSPAYVALEEILVSSAQTLALIHETTKAEGPNSAAAGTALANIAIAASSLNNMGTIGQAFVKEARSFLDAQGANYIYHDQLSQNINTVQTELSRMQSFLNKGP